MRIILTTLLCACTGFAHAGEDGAFMAKLKHDCPSAAAWYESPGIETAMRLRAVPEPERYTEPALREQLKAMVTADQDARKAIGGLANNPGSAELVAAWKKVSAVDAHNLPEIEAIVKRYGFPTVAMVGRAGVGAAWLLVQHADRDPAFQAEVLAILAPHVDAGDVRRGDLALLTDRVPVAQGKPQRYGSQFALTDGVWHPKATEDPARLDARRADMDLPPMADYACVLKSSQGGTGQYSTEPLPEPSKEVPAP